jgi:hypothetical protein
MDEHDAAMDKEWARIDGLCDHPEPAPEVDWDVSTYMASVPTPSVPNPHVESARAHLETILDDINDEEDKT